MRVDLGPQHPSSGGTRHTIRDASGSRDFPAFVSLEIVRFGNADFYLMHQCANGLVADTWHETLEDAMYQADYEFNVKAEDWTKTEREYL